MDSPRYHNVILTVIASLLAVIAFGRVTTNRVATLVPAAYAAQSSGDLALLAVGNEGVVTRLLVWDKAAGASPQLKREPLGRMQTRSLFPN